MASDPNPTPERPEITHRCPPKGSGATPCCGRTPFELPGTDRMTLDETLVTCRPERPESPSEETQEDYRRVLSPARSDDRMAAFAEVIRAAREQARRDRDMEWWEAIVQVDGVAPTPEAAKKFLLDLATHEQEGAREQGRREGLEQAAKWHDSAARRNRESPLFGVMSDVGLLVMAHEDAADCIRAIAEETKR